MSNFRNVFTEAGYAALEQALVAAYERASRGKGKERHAGKKPFDQQPIFTIARLLENIHGHSYQIIKKTHEAPRLMENGNYNGAMNEYLDIIVYAAVAFQLVAEQRERFEKSINRPFDGKVEHHNIVTDVAETGINPKPIDDWNPTATTSVAGVNHK